MNQVLTTAVNYLSPMEFDLLKLSLSVRTYSPAIEMSRKVIVLYYLIEISLVWLKSTVNPNLHDQSLNVRL